MPTWSTAGRGPSSSSLFRPDAEVVIDRRAGEPLRLVGGGEVGAFIGSAIAHFTFFEFVVLNAHIVFPDGPDAGTAVCRLFMCELRQDGDTGRFSTAFGLYHDRYVLDAGQLVVRRAALPLAGPPRRGAGRVPAPHRPGHRRSRRRDLSAPSVMR